MTEPACEPVSTQCAIYWYGSLRDIKVSGGFQSKVVRIPEIPGYHTTFPQRTNELDCAPRTGCTCARTLSTSFVPLMYQMCKQVETVCYIIRFDYFGVVLYVWCLWYARDFDNFDRTSLYFDFKLPEWYAKRRTDVPCVRAAVQSDRRCDQTPSVSASLQRNRRRPRRRRHVRSLAHLAPCALESGNGSLTFELFV